MRGIFNRLISSFVGFFFGRIAEGAPHWKIRRDGRFGILYSEKSCGEIQIEGELLPLSGHWYVNKTSILGTKFPSGEVISRERCEIIMGRIEEYFQRKGIVLHVVEE